MAEHAAPEHAAPEHAAGGVADRLTHKVGPLPVWAWAALLLVAFFLYQRFKGSSSTTPAASNPPGSGADMNPVPAAGDQTDSGLGAGFGGSSGPPGDTGGAGNPSDTGGTGSGSGGGDGTGGGSGGGGTGGGAGGGATGPGSGSGGSGHGGIAYFGPGGGGIYYPPAPTRTSGGSTTGQHRISWSGVSAETAFKAV